MKFKKLMDNVDSVAVGDGRRTTEYILVLKTDNTLWAQGSNMYGQLGNGAVTKYKNHYKDRGTCFHDHFDIIEEITENNDSKIPVKIMDNVASISTGHYCSFALKTDDTLWAWGQNEIGQLGDGTTANKCLPIKIMDDVAIIKEGVCQNYAIKNDGSLWMWGFNFIDCHREPVKIMDNVVSVFNEIGYSVAIKTDGSLWGFGNNIAMIRYNEPSEPPVKIMDGVTDVATQEACFFVINENETLIKCLPYTFNKNYKKEGRHYRKNHTKKIMGNAVSISASNHHCLAVKKSKALWVWGCNKSGQLGINTAGSSFDYIEKPVKLMEDVMFAIAGTYCSFAVKTDSSLWGWGKNDLCQPYNDEQLELDYRTTPIKLMDDVRFVSSKRNLVIKNDGSLWVMG